MVRLKDKVAVITGAGSGIGMETARTFHREGAYTVLADIEPEAAAAAAREIDQAGERSLAVTADVSKHEAVAGLMEAALAKWGRVDILVNNAGITRDAQLTQMTLDQFDHVIAVNLRGVYLCGQAAARIMLEQGQGVIINMSSIVGIHGNFGQSNYAAAKAGVIGMTKTWARELGRKGIRVNAVAPGFILTAMTEKMPEKILEAMRERCPMKKLGRPQDIANACLFLASEEAAYVNGAVLEVTGGMTL
jgi:3-oxoacyl-[acyl-carrier protein] reductase